MEFACSPWPVWVFSGFLPVAKNMQIGSSKLPKGVNGYSSLCKHCTRLATSPGRTLVKVRWDLASPWPLLNQHQRKWMHACIILTMLSGGNSFLSMPKSMSWDCVSRDTGHFKESFISCVSKVLLTRWNLVYHVYSFYIQYGPTAHLSSFLFSFLGCEVIGLKYT